MVKFLGFGHRKQMGKDTAAKFFKKILDKRHHPGLNVECRAFADIGYEICNKLYGWDGFGTKMYYDMNPEKKSVPLPNIGKSPRQILIDVGTNAFRKNVWENTWVEYMAHIHPKDHNALVLLTDVRFPNEFGMVKRDGGFNFKIVRPDVPLTDDVADCALEGVSFDFEIVNDGTPEELGVKVYKTFVEYLKPFTIETWMSR